MFNIIDAQLISIFLSLATSCYLTGVWGVGRFLTKLILVIFTAKEGIHVNTFYQRYLIYLSTGAVK